MNEAGNGDTAPWIRNQSPASGFNDTDGYLFLTCNVTDNHNIVNVSLYHNISGSWGLNQTISTSGQEVSPTFNVTGLTDGSYLWNCLAYDNSSQNVWGENRTIDVGIGITISHTISAKIVNNINLTSWLIISYSKYLNNSVVLGNITIIETDDGDIYYSRNISNSSYFEAGDLTIRPNLIDFDLNNIFDSNFSVGNTAGLNITLTYYFNQNWHTTNHNTTLTIIGQ